MSESCCYFWVGVIPTQRVGVYFVFTIKQYATFGSRQHQKKPHGWRHRHLIYKTNTPILGVCSGGLNTLPLTLVGRSLKKKQFVSVLNSLIMSWLHVLCPALSSLTSFYSVRVTAMGCLVPVSTALMVERTYVLFSPYWVVEEANLWI
jgi:hypothetical protein